MSTEERAAQGLAFIRKHGAALGIDLGRVDLDTLDQSDGMLCVLGQATVMREEDSGGNGYATAMDRAARDLGVLTWLSGWSYVHGFTERRADAESYAELTEAWRRLLAAERESTTV